MNKNNLAIISCFIIVIVAHAQEKYVKFHEITFQTELEKRLVKAAKNDSLEFSEAFLAISPEDSQSFTNWKSFYQREIDALKNQKRSKKLSKDIRFIYDELHEKFLRKYENIAFFDQIFQNGVYNCVTAVALYAMSFDELGIPYQIKETPTHVYIVADPNGSSILIETTDPISGYKDFTPGFREAFVAQLGAMKLVDQNDINNKGIYGVFEEAYFGGATLTLKQLIGIQYYNLGYTYFDDREYHQAWNAYAKAQLFHDNEQINSMLFASLANILSSSDYSDWEDISMLPYLERFEDFDINKANIVGEFQRMLHTVLISNNNLELAEKAYNHFISAATNEEIKKEVSYTYYHESAVIEYNRANYSKAFDYSTSAYQAKPGNSSAENLMRESFRLTYMNRTTEEALSRLDTLISKNPDLTDNNHFTTLRLNLYLEAMGESFDKKRPNEGNNYMGKFEEHLIQFPNQTYDQYVLSNAYSKAAVYYYKRGYVTKARSIIQNGLKYVPDSYELKTRMRMINR